ncbi:unnamed protein product [Prorocentrum cordatum]|uniref:Uncharacterized protein n=1 Tax=Prorocentrum cordatum TaxID=2364126 RepID=A0ABN9UFB3_9DINO|nr:unnamed protein product [Polarella glacialis]
MAAKRDAWLARSIVLVQGIPVAMSVQVQTLDEYQMTNGSMNYSMNGSSKFSLMTTTLPWSSVHDPTSPDRADCPPYNDDICIKNSPYWGSQHSCTSSIQFCTSWAKDMQRCCSLACGTVYLTEMACAAVTSAGSCRYPHSGSSDCGGTATPVPTPSVTLSPSISMMPDEPTWHAAAGGAAPMIPEEPTWHAAAGGAAPMMPDEPTWHAAAGGAAPMMPDEPTWHAAAGGAAPMIPEEPTWHAAAGGTAPVSAAGGVVASATGDPHLQNIHGEKFDLMKPGKHVLIQIPRKRTDSALLRVDAGVHVLGTQCADMYFQELNITGAWADVKRAGGLHYHAQDADDTSYHWSRFGNVQMKVAKGRTKKGIKYPKCLRHSAPMGGARGWTRRTRETMVSPGCINDAVVHLSLPA